LDYVRKLVAELEVGTFGKGGAGVLQNERGLHAEEREPK
jgi:hypothetical protein